MNCSNLFSKYSALTLSLIVLCLVQCGTCYKDTKWRTQQQQKKQSRDNNQLNDNYYSSQNITARDASVDPVPGPAYPPRDLGSLSLPSVDIPKPSSAVAYHRSIHNTSWAITIPLFSFSLPTTKTGDPVNIGNQALYGFFAAVITIITFAVPILFNGQVPGARSLASERRSLNHLLHPGHVMNLAGLNMASQLENVGIDPMQCLQKIVCEAYRSPQNQRYGMLALPFQYFFVARNVSESEAASRSIYELAARDGKFTKTDCKKKYECMFDALDLASYCLSVYKRSRKNAATEPEGAENLMSIDKLFL